jgi:amino acid transporter
MMLERAITKGNLLLMSAGGMVGASWLFSPYISVKMAGTYAMLAWFIISVIMFLIALPLCELGVLFPVAGGMVNYPNMTHGRGFGFLFSWTSWLAYVVCGPIEVQAVLQYASHFFPTLVDRTQVGFHLSHFGTFWAIAVLVIVTLINTLGIHLFIRCNRVISIFKFIIPICAIIGFFTVAPSMTHHIEWRLPTSTDFHGIFTALSLGGIAFAFTGFQNGLLMAGEVKNPEKALPLSLLGAVAIGFVLYSALQWGFIIAVPDTALSQGWQNLSFSGDSGPLVGLAMILGLSGIAMLLMIDASVSPLGTTLVYSAATARILYAMGINQDLPKVVSKLNRFKVPAIALLVNLVVGSLSFLPFSGWQHMVAFLSSCSILSYLIGPICLLSFRKYRAHENAGFRLKFTKTVCFLGFYAGMLMLLWCGFDIVWKLALSILVGVTLHVLADRQSLQQKSWLLWFGLFFALLLPISYSSQYGGIGILSIPFDLLLMLPVSFVLMRFAVRYADESRIMRLPIRVSEEEACRLELVNAEMECEKL